MVCVGGVGVVFGFDIVEQRVGQTNLDAEVRAQPICLIHEVEHLFARLLGLFGIGQCEGVVDCGEVVGCLSETLGEGIEVALVGIAEEADQRRAAVDEHKGTRVDERLTRTRTDEGGSRGGHTGHHAGHVAVVNELAADVYGVAHAAAV